MLSSRRLISWIENRMSPGPGTDETGPSGSGGAAGPALLGAERPPGYWPAPAQRPGMETISKKRGVAIAATKIAGGPKGEARSPPGAGCGLLGRSSRRGLFAGHREDGWLAG